MFIRAYRGEDDLTGIVVVSDAEARAEGVMWRESVDQLRARFGHPSPQFDASRDVAIAESDEGIVGHVRVRWTDMRDGVRAYLVTWFVHPDWYRRRLAARLLDWGERRARTIAATHSTPRPRVLASETAEHQAGANELLETFGYTPVRWAFDMVKDPIGELDPPPLPAGLEVRPVDDHHSRAAWDARNEAFLDLSGGVDTSDAAFRSWVGDPALDRSLFVVAWDGSEIAGGVFNALHPDERSQGAVRGWLDSVFTRRPWRGRGLASGLIARSLTLLADRGAASAALGVDADNPSGALSLYTKAGFSVADRYTEWRKPMQDFEN